MMETNRAGPLLSTFSSPSSEGAFTHDGTPATHLTDFTPEYGSTTKRCHRVIDAAPPPPLASWPASPTWHDENDGGVETLQAAFDAFDPFGGARVEPSTKPTSLSATAAAFSPRPRIDHGLCKSSQPRGHYLKITNVRRSATVGELNSIFNQLSQLPDLIIVAHLSKHGIIFVRFSTSTCAHSAQRELPSTVKGWHIEQIESDLSPGFGNASIKKSSRSDVMVVALLDDDAATSLLSTPLNQHIGQILRQHGTLLSVRETFYREPIVEFRVSFQTAQAADQAMSAAMFDEPGFPLTSVWILPLPASVFDKPPVQVGNESYIATNGPCSSTSANASAAMASSNDRSLLTSATTGSIQAHQASSTEAVAPDFSERGSTWNQCGNQRSGSWSKAPSHPNAALLPRPLDRRQRDMSLPTHNVVDVDRIQRGLDVRTTIMLRNIPNKIDQAMLKEFIDETSRGKYDFMYLRIDFANNCNVGYAFINFEDPWHIVDFVRHRAGRRWNCFGSDKVAEVSYATIQGKDCLIQKFRNSSVMLEHASFRPKIFHTDASPYSGTEDDFPPPDNPSKMKRSVENAEHVGLFAPRVNHYFRDIQRRRHSRFDRGTRLANMEEQCPIALQASY